MNGECWVEFDFGEWQGPAYSWREVGFVPGEGILTRDYKETIKGRLARDPSFREALKAEDLDTVLVDAIRKSEVSDDYAYLNKLLEE
jgi:hypothetical protein